MSSSRKMGGRKVNADGACPNEKNKVDAEPPTMTENPTNDLLEDWHNRSIKKRVKGMSGFMNCSIIQTVSEQGGIMGTLIQQVISGMATVRDLTRQPIRQWYAPVSRGNIGDVAKVVLVPVVYYLYTGKDINTYGSIVQELLNKVAFWRSTLIHK
ncbi:hypothetical protein T01_4231 [Trichinella spiralis]|uniref:Uncharacterized protein n=1 Tax=Trichinella spiralis TaxID=6334 RepID=A0A0V1ASQ7_TRISP|nr:hypothetical protein T01_4231 [Trichinella spiralis]